MRVTKEKLEELSRNYDIYLKKLNEYKEALERVKEKEGLTLPKNISVSEDENTLILRGTMLGKELEDFVGYIFKRKDVAIEKLRIVNEKGLPIRVEGAMFPSENLIKFEIILKKVR